MTRNSVLFCSPQEAWKAPQQRSECHYVIYILRVGLPLKWRASSPDSLSPSSFKIGAWSLNTAKLENKCKVSEGNGFGDVQITWGAAMETQLRAGVPEKSEFEIWWRIPVRAGVPTHFFQVELWILSLSCKLDGKDHIPEWYIGIPK